MEDGGDMMVLFMWIKRDQEERKKHAEYMARKNARDDQQYMQLIVNCLTKFKCSRKEKIILLNFARVNKEGRNLSTGQRSVISGIYYKKLDKQLNAG